MRTVDTYDGTVLYTLVGCVRDYELILGWMDEWMDVWCWNFFQFDFLLHGSHSHCRRVLDLLSSPLDSMYVAIPIICQSTKATQKKDPRSVITGKPQAATGEVVRTGGGPFLY